MIKVLHILSDSNLGGAGRWVQSYVRGHDRDRFEIGVVLPKGSRAGQLFEGLPCRLLSAEIEGDRSMDLRANRAFKEIIRGFSPDIVHTHGSLSGRIAARQCHVKKILYTKHTMSAVRSGIKAKLLAAVDNRLCDGIIAVSEATRRNLLENGADPAKIHLVYAGIEPVRVAPQAERDAQRRKWGFASEQVVVGIVARLEPVKDHDTFLRGAAAAARRDSSLRFVVAGTGSLEKQLQALAQELALSDRIRFEGELSDVAPVLNACDIVVLTSENETFGLALLEAQTLGKATVASRVGGIPELLADEVTGLLFEPGNPLDFSEKLLRLAQDSALRQKIGKAGQERYREQFTTQDFARTLETIYLEGATQ